MNKRFDLFVIGAGSGGVRAARMAAKAGLSVGVCEDKKLGGTCVNVGCVPKKLFSYAAHYREEVEDGPGLGWTSSSPSFSWPTFMAQKNKEIERLNRVYDRILRESGVDIIHGRGKLTGPHTVEVAGETIEADHILIATGGRPFVPQIPGRTLGITSDGFFHLSEQPRRAAVIGGGYIGVELASIFHGLGTETQLHYRGPMFLRGFDNDVRHFLADEMRKKGMSLHFECDVHSLEKTDTGIRMVLDDGDEVETDIVLFATGRRPNIEGLGLSHIGIELTDRGSVAVDDTYRTNLPHIFAIGDVIDHLNLTPVALAQGMAVVRSLTGGDGTCDLDNVPTAVFSNPHIGTVGLTEEQARAQVGDIDVYRSTFTPMRHTLSGRPEKTLMKLIVDQASDRVLGVHVVGPEAGEIVQGFAVALKAGATKAVFDTTIGIHPTAAEELVTMRDPVPPPSPYEQ